MKTHLFLPFLLAALATLPAAALASTTGRIPVGPETTPGNSAVLYIINQPGSYYLDGPVHGATGQSGIRITSGGVSLDLNGFALTGDSTAGSTGLHVNFASGPVRIHNGSVRNWRGDGIHVQGSSIDLSHLHVSDNGGKGFLLGEDTTGSVVDCISEHNGDRGFVVWDLSSNMSAINFTRCIARENDSYGFMVRRSVVSHCSAIRNGNTGFYITTGSTLVDSLSSNNSTAGVYALSTLMERCTISANAGDGVILSGGTVRNCAVLGNGFNGIRANGLAEVYDNRIHGHDNGTSAGIVVGGGRNRIENNNLSVNGYGIRVTNSGNFIARNTASSLVRNYSISAGNRVGTIVVPGSSPAIEGNSGGGSGTTDPWSNIAY